ncbi:MAG TPA: thioredoxin family protein [Patescibacteria group bacterium]|jgi:thioredoxin 1|nr:thioredoxin family protein [Patescibacteria group bacterium]
MAISISKANYQTEVIASKKPVIIDVFAVWCGPCQMMKPVFAALEKEYGHAYIFATLNVEEDRDLSTELGVTSIPSFLFFDKGKLLGKEVGVINTDVFKKLLISYFGEQ